MSRRHWMAAVLWVGFATVGVTRPHADEVKSDDDLISDHLVAGEFGPALQLARQSQDEHSRDADLRRIAMAQSRAGMRDSASRTAGEINHESLRANTLAGVAQEPIRMSGAPGGAALADFDSLIDLITSTIAPTTWDDVGGPGSIDAFPGGVFVDAQGALTRSLSTDAAHRLTAFHRAAASPAGETDVRQSSTIRKISLPRLERAIQIKLAAGQSLDEEMLILAGLQRIQYVLVYPQTGDLVLAGPAGDWNTNLEGRIVSAESGRPLVRLDDLIVVMRHMTKAADVRFGCAITPRAESLAKAQQYLDSTNGRTISSRRRGQWLEELRKHVGPQDIDVFGIDPRTRVAQVLVEADYRMKLIGIGLEDGTANVPSYLDLITVAPGQAPPAMDVLRWWFTLNYDAVTADPSGNVFELRGQGVRVMSENELLTAKGERIHTGKSDLLNQQFTGNFTQHFGELSAKYPIYAELQNMFDLALVGALIRAEDLLAEAGWSAECFLDPTQYVVELGQAPKSVETVANWRVINKVHIVAAVSGGVDVQPAVLVSKDAIHGDQTAKLSAQHHYAAPRVTLQGAWWWD